MTPNPGTDSPYSSLDPISSGTYDTSRSYFRTSHGTHYADLSFQCAHLSSQYPAQFLSSLINNGHGPYTCEAYLDEARRRGIQILPLDVNASRLAYHGRDNWIRPGLFPMRDCREAAMRVLVQEREAHGPYQDLLDLLQRVPLHKRETEPLILAGGMGCFGLTQAELLYLLDAAYAKIRPTQADLFGGFGGAFGAGRRKAGQSVGSPQKWTKRLVLLGN